MGCCGRRCGDRSCKFIGKLTSARHEAAGLAEPANKMKAEHLCDAYAASAKVAETRIRLHDLPYMSALRENSEKWPIGARPRSI